MMTHPRRLMCVVLIAICGSSCTIAEIQAHIGRSLTADEAESHRVHNRVTIGGITLSPQMARNREMGHAMALGRGWSEQQFACWDYIIMRESAWDHLAQGPTDDVGVAQASPGNKMASHGADWRTNPITQMTWGLDYIEDRYGTACAAKATKVRSGIY